MKEKNRLATEHEERKRLEPGYGAYESETRLHAVSAALLEALGICY
jgi:hypothetical protein